GRGARNDRSGRAGRQDHLYLHHALPVAGGSRHPHKVRHGGRRDRDLRQAGRASRDARRGSGLRRLNSIRRSPREERLTGERGLWLQGAVKKRRISRQRRSAWSVSKRNWAWAEPSRISSSLGPGARSYCLRMSISRGTPPAVRSPRATANSFRPSIFSGGPLAWAARSTRRSISPGRAAIAASAASPPPMLPPITETVSAPRCRR